MYALPVYALPVPALALVRLSLEKAPVTGKVQPAQGCPGDRLADRSQAAMETAP